MSDLEIFQQEAEPPEITATRPHPGWWDRNFGGSNHLQLVVSTLPGLVGG